VRIDHLVAYVEQAGLPGITPLTKKCRQRFPCRPRVNDSGFYTAA
jgi:hypothetical protein